MYEHKKTGFERERGGCFKRGVGTHRKFALFSRGYICMRPAMLSEHMVWFPAVSGEFLNQKALWIYGHFIFNYTTFFKHTSGYLIS